MLLQQAVRLQILPAVAAHFASFAAGAAAVAAIAACAACAPLDAWLPPDRRRLLHDRERVLRWRHHLNDERV